MNYPFSPLLTDLYQLTMMQAYHDNGMQDEAVFEFFFRKLPSERSFLVACGLQQVIEYLETLKFEQEDIDFLKKDGRFHDHFLDSLVDLKFTGSVHALPEGTVFFADEPVIRITAPLPVAQLVETRIINILQFQTMIASKAARMKLLLPDKLLVDYGLRRSHGAEAGVMAARASYIAGFEGTATVLAGKLYGIPLYGTMAHAFIQAHDSENSAFQHFATSHPENTVILLDTFDTEQAAKKVVKLAAQLQKENIHIKGVRLDSGDMVALSRTVRQILDAGGLQEVKIFASGNLDEYSLEIFKTENAPVDGFGIGSKMTTSADLPYFDCAYKLVEYGGVGRRKLSTNKITWPGRKQVFRQPDANSIMDEDILALSNESCPGVPLIQHYMQEGKRCNPLPTLCETRDYFLKQLTTLPSLKTAYTVTASQNLREYAEDVAERMKKLNSLDM